MLNGAQPENGNGKKGGEAISLKRILREKLESDSPDKKYSTLGEAVVVSTLKAALKGDAAARKLVWEYIEGAPNAKLVIESVAPYERIGEVLAKHGVDETVAVAIIGELTGADS